MMVICMYKNQMKNHEGKCDDFEILYLYIDECLRFLYPLKIESNTDYAMTWNLDNLKLNLNLSLKIVYN